MQGKLVQYKDNLIYIALHAERLFKSLRWSGGLVCPYCGEAHIWKFKDGTYKCSRCHRKFSDTSNTIFHSTKIPKSHWMIGFYLMAMGKGVPSKELSEYLGITQKSCWYMLHQIRIALDTSNIALEGNIAVDEVYLGGKWSSIIVPKKIGLLKRYNLWYEGQPKRTWSNRNICRAIAEYKQPVYGMNDGKHIVLRAVPNRFNSKDLLKLTLQHTANVQRLVSDQSSLYKDIAKTGIEVVQMNHSKHEFSNQGLSSNRIEGTFSHLKRRHQLQYVRPGKKYIQLYLNEFCFRWNSREDPVLERLSNIMRCCCSVGKVTRKDVDKYYWQGEFAPRKDKHRECIEDWLDVNIWGVAESIEVDGIRYRREDVERLAKLRHTKKDIEELRDLSQTRSEHCETSLDSSLEIDSSISLGSFGR